jgi:catechol 2,3-dioxygenase-like lactoylglutathione lyase family enzyme
MKVLRHEEFEEECEATCNGPFAGHWSKTMMNAHADGERGGFALEIIYNYGKKSYEQGNSFRHLVLRDQGLASLAKARAWWAALDLAAAPDAAAAAAAHTTRDPDGHAIVCVDADCEDQFVCVSLFVRNLDKALAYYRDVLHAAPSSRELPGASAGGKAVLLGGPVGVELVASEPGAELVHGETKGRFAVETEDGGPDAIAKQAVKVLHGPLALPPHHERVVVVCDLDDHEYAFVERKGYAKCIEAGAKSIDWEYRAKKEQRQKVWNDRM